jgi:hypothetical protein
LINQAGPYTTPFFPRVTLSHTGFTKNESVSNHDAGWDSYMEGFRKFLAVK